MTKVFVGEKTQVINVPRSRFYIITDRELAKPIGFLGISKTNELVGLFIEPKYRRKGYATDIIKSIENERKIHLTTSPKNIPLQKLLEKLGYSKWYKYVKTD